MLTVIKIHIANSNFVSNYPARAEGIFDCPVYLHIAYYYLDIDQKQRTYSYNE